MERSIISFHILLWNLAYWYVPASFTSFGNWDPPCVSGHKGCNVAITKCIISQILPVKPRALPVRNDKLWLKREKLLLHICASLNWHYWYYPHGQPLVIVIMGKKFLLQFILRHPHLDMGMLLLSHHYLAQVGWVAFFVNPCKYSWPYSGLDLGWELFVTWAWSESSRLYPVHCTLYPVPSVQVWVWSAAAVLYFGWHFLCLCETQVTFTRVVAFGSTFQMRQIHFTI